MVFREAGYLSQFINGYILLYVVSDIQENWLNIEF